MISHATATEQVSEVARRRFRRGGKSKAEEKILGKGKNGLTELGGINKKKKREEVVEKEVKSYFLLWN